MVPIEFHSDLVLEGDEAFYAEVDRCVAQEEDVIRSGKVASVLHQPQAADGGKRHPGKRPDAQRQDQRRRTEPGGPSEGHACLYHCQGRHYVQHRGTEALGVKKANVLGQICPGIPVWQTDAGSRFPGIPYVIFPGNVGGEETLRQAVEILVEE